MAGDFAPASSCSFPLVQLQCKSQPTGRFGDRDLVEGRRLFSCQCERMSRTVEGPHEASKQQGRDCRRRETKRAVRMRGSSEGEVGGTPLPQPESRVNSRAVPDLRANSSWPATVRIRPVVGRFRFRLSTNRPKSRRKIVTPGKALVLAVSKSSARRDQFLWQQCMPFCAVDCCESDLLFLCQRTSLIRRSIQATPPGKQVGKKTQSPCSIAQRACWSQDSGPQGCPMPHLVCLSLPLSRPSISVSGSQVST